MNKSKDVMKVTQIIFTLLILSLTFQSVWGQQKIINNNCKIPFNLKFEKVGILYVLLEPQYFKPQELKNLFLCLSQKRLELTFLQITVFSDEAKLDKDIKSFENDFTKKIYTSPPEVGFKLKGWKPAQPPPPNNYRAYYYRYKNEYFEYSPNPQSWDLRTIMIKNKILQKRVSKLTLPPPWFSGKKL